MYLLPKINTRLFEVPGRSVISSSGTLTEMCEFLDHHLQPIIKRSRSYFKYTEDFLENLGYVDKVPSNAILVSVDIVGLYPSIPHEVGLKALCEKKRERVGKKFHCQI